ncbi:lamin tail domain-containing protein [Candidatus Bipolaricaulota bacterium]
MLNVLCSEIMLKRRLLPISVLLMGLLLGGCISPTLLPVATFTYAPASGESPLIVTFDASESQSPNGSITEFAWDFGDGNTGQGMITAHSYQTDVERVYPVTLQVTDHLGGQASISAQVTVQAQVSEAADPSVEFVWPFHPDASGEDAANLNDEYFALQNTGDEPIDLSKWTVENERGLAYRFPDGVTLAPNALLYVHSGSGSNTTGIFYWNAAEPVWNNNSDLAVLRDADGTIIDFYSYYSC